MNQVLSLNLFPEYSEWPARILGYEDFVPKQRDEEQVKREYDQDKWGAILHWLRFETQDAQFEDLIRLQGYEPDLVIPYSKGDEFYLGPTLELCLEYEKILAQFLKPHENTGTLVELGSGLGDKLLRLSLLVETQQLLGGEYTDSGVECGKILSDKWNIPAGFQHFNYYDPNTLAWLPENAVIYTSHSIEQIPYLDRSFFEAVIEKKPKAVLHFEPCYELYTGNTMVDLMRRRYVELNDYNRNLLSMLKQLESENKIKINELHKNIYSVNPLNPTTVISWSAF